MSSYNISDIFDESSDDGGETSRDRVYRLLEAHSAASQKAKKRGDREIADAEVDASSKVGDRALAGGMMGSLWTLGGGAAAAVPWGAGIGLGVGILDAIRARKERGDSWGKAILGGLNPLNMVPSLGATAAAAPMVAGMASQKAPMGNHRSELNLDIANNPSFKPPRPMNDLGGYGGAVAPGRTMHIGANKPAPAPAPAPVPVPTSAPKPAMNAIEAEPVNSNTGMGPTGMQMSPDQEAMYASLVNSGMSPDQAMMLIDSGRFGVG